MLVIERYIISIPISMLSLIFFSRIGYTRNIKKNICGLAAPETRLKINDSVL